MKEAHLSLEILADLLAGELDPEILRQKVLPHFLSKCSGCRKEYEALLRLKEDVGHWDERVAVFEGREAPKLFEELREHPFEEQLRLVREESEFHTWALCQILLKNSKEYVFDEPLMAIGVAELAVKITSNLGDAYDPHWVLDLKARSYAYLGNARRVLGEIRSAETAFRQAEWFLSRSLTGNEAVRAEILHLKSSLRRQQRRLTEAEQLIDQALAIYRALEDHHGIGVVLVNKAKSLEESGNLEGAIELLREAVQEVGPKPDIRLPAYVRYNLVGCLAAAGHFEEAHNLLEQIKPLFQRVARPVDFIRLRWAEGRIGLGLGNTVVAEQAFREVRGEFLRRGMAYDAALVSLDLALLLIGQHRTKETKGLAKELIPIFESNDIQREVIASLYLFQRACEEERLTAELIQQLSKVFESELRRKSR